MQKHFFVSIFLVFFSIAASAQFQDIETVEQKFKQYSSQNFQEKVFVHTDKNFYLSGETIWFKVYATEALTNIPTPISKVAYVELYNQDKKPALQAKVPLKQAVGNAQFLLPLNLPTGNYTLRAYTNLMKNQDVHFAFEKPISIVNVFNAPTVDTVQKTLNYDVQFFPEGGNLVNGITSKVGFKALNSNGQSVACSGKIVNQNNDSITSFSTEKFGLGSFVFTPQTGNNYKAIIQINNQIVSTALPTAYNNGFVMLTTVENNTVKVSVKASNDFSNDVVHVLVHANHQTQFKQSQKLQNGVAVFTFSKEQLADGIQHITLFNSQLQAVCERLIYKPFKNIVEAKITANQQVFNTRNKVAFDVSTITQNKLVEANLSLTVVKNDSLQALNEDVDMQQYHWLYAHVKGYVEQPSYFINNETALDLLLLTQGWRRFNWNDVIADKKPNQTFLPEYESQIISGKVINKQTLQPAEGVAVYLSLPGKEFGFANAYSTADGSFYAIMPNLFGTTELVAQTNNKIDSNYRIDIQTPYWSQFSTTKYPLFPIGKSLSNTLNNAAIALQAEKIYAPKKVATTSSNIGYKPFYIQPDEKYFLDSYTRFTTMEEVMREYIKGVLVRRKNNKFVFYVSDNPRFQYFEGEPLILVDGIPLFDADKIIAADPLKFQQLDVIARRFFSGKLVFDGIVNYSSYDGTMGIKSLSAESLVIDYDGLQAQREFYSPQYATPTAVESRIPDYRTVLYWNGNVQTKNNSGSKIEFYTSDVAGKYTAILQGITPFGDVIKTTINFEVKE